MDNQAFDIFPAQTTGMPQFKIFHAEGIKNFGVASKILRTKEQDILNDDFINAMPNFKIFGSVKDTPKKVCLWDYSRKINNNKDFKTLRQITGSCFPAGVLVRMADGSQKSIEDIEVGELVVSHDGSVNKVINTFSRPFDKYMVKVQLEAYPFPLEMTEDHEVPVNVDGKIENVVWKKASDLKEKDQLVISYKKNSDNYLTVKVTDYCKDFQIDDKDPTKIRIKKARYDSSINNEFVVDEDFARFIGLYLAEGGCHENRVTFTFNRDEQDLVDFVAKTGEKLFGKKAEIQKQESRPTATKVRFAHINMANFLTCFAKGNVYSKSVPGVFFNSSNSVKESLLKGWFDGDGHKQLNEKRFRLVGVSVSKKLIEDMYVISASLGIYPSIFVRKAHKQSKIAYSLTLSGQKALELYPDFKERVNELGIKSYKQAYCDMDFGHARKIKKIEKTKTEQITVYDIEVENTHSFIANNIAVHNCVAQGFGNVLWYLQAIEIVKKGEEEECKQPFFLLPYGRSRLIGGLRGRGEGSFGSAMAEAAKRDGCFAFDEQGIPKPTIIDSGSWDDGLTYGEKLEMEWSDGARIDEKWLKISRKHLIKTVSLCRNADDVRDAIINGYPLTIASNWGGTMRPKAQGSKEPILLNTRTDTWQHQMCLLKDAVIHGEKFKTIDKIKVGDNVIGHDGKLHKVTEVFERDYSGNIVRLVARGKTSDPLNLTPNHPVLIFRPIMSCGSLITPWQTYNITEKAKEYMKTQPMWVNAEDVQEGDYLLSVKPEIRTDKSRIPEYEHNKKALNVPNKIAVNDDLAWLFGLFIADGNAVKNHKICITLNLKESGFANKAKKIIEDNFGIEAYINYKKNCIRVYCYSSVLGNFFKKWFYDENSDKVIPEFLFSEWNLNKLIDGIFDGDGCITKDNHFRIVTSSNILKEQIYSILLSLGFCPKVNENGNNKVNLNWSRCFDINWNDDKFNESKKEDCGFFDKYSCRRVTSKLFLPYTGKVYNFEVEDVHSYVADGFVVHNCVIGWWEHPEFGEVYYIMNSWGTLTHGKCPSGAPMGGFWVRKKDMDYIARQQEAFAFSQYDGFPAQKLEDYLFDIFRK